MAIICYRRPHQNIDFPSLAPRLGLPEYRTMQTNARMPSRQPIFFLGYGARAVGHRDLVDSPPSGCDLRGQLGLDPEPVLAKVVDEDARATQVLADLIDVGALDGECQLLEHWCERFTTTVIREPELRALEEAVSPHLRALYFYDFSVSFVRYDVTTLDFSLSTTVEDCC